jgi:GNAT superfamily N-acetyltransferase
MTITQRPYHYPEDYARISAFLIRHHRPDNRDGNWLEPTWEYMHFHPALNTAALNRIGIWEDSGEIVAAVHFETDLGEAFFQFDPDYRRLRTAMLDYAEERLWGRRGEDGGNYLAAFVNDGDAPFTELVRSRGYVRKPAWSRPMSRYTIRDPFPEITLPEGFRLTSLAEEPDWGKVHQVLWRGFDHGDNPPMTAEALEDRRKMFDTPRARRDLKIIVKAPNGEFAAFCGMFYEDVNRYAYVEPVATDPRYRRMGLGRAAVLEGIRRCGALGAVEAYVGSHQPFYLSFGFEVVHTDVCWVKYREA